MTDWEDLVKKIHQANGIARRALYTIHQNHGEESCKYALSIFKEIEDNNVQNWYSNCESQPFVHSMLSDRLCR